MRLITSITALTIGAMIGSGSAAAIDTALVAREFPSWPNFHVPDGLVKVASGTISGVNGAIRNGVNTIQNVTNGAVQNVNNVIHDPGSVVLAALTPNKQNCPLIIQKTDWQKYLGVAPVVAAINKPCDWTVTLLTFRLLPQFHPSLDVQCLCANHFSHSLGYNARYMGWDQVWRELHACVDRRVCRLCIL